MANPAHRPKAENCITQELFTRTWFECECSPARVAETLKVDVRGIYKWRERLSAQGVDLPSLNSNPSYQRPSWTYPRELHIQIHDGTIFVGSDVHIWPEAIVPTPPIRRVFSFLSKKLKVDYCVLNGDLVDGARLSRFPKLRSSVAPRFKDELEQAKKFVLGLGGKGIFVLGNHDARLDAYLANRAEEVEDIAPRLGDYLPGWDLGYALVVNDSVEVRHNFRGGIHTAYNNTLHSGRTLVTGHTHQLDVKSWTDRNGLRWGVECGMLADPFSPQFEYTLGMPNRWQSGFVILTWVAGQLLPPEKCEVVGGKVVFRGKVYE